MRIATWNVGSLSGLARSSYDRVTAIVKPLLPLDLDVVCFQELIVNPDLIDALSKLLGLPYAFFKDLSACNPNGETTGIGLLSRTRAELLGEHRLYNPLLVMRPARANGKDLSFLPEKMHEKAFIACRIGNIIIVTGHSHPLHRYEVAEEVFADTLYAPLDRWVSGMCRDGGVVCLAGDLNAEDAGRLMPATFARLTPCRFGPTRPSGEIHDYIMVGGTEALEARTVAVGGFDHHICMTRIVPPASGGDE